MVISENPLQKRHGHPKKLRLQQFYPRKVIINFDAQELFGA